MLFHSVEFWIFFAAIFAIALAVPAKVRWVLLLLGSYYFYGFWKWQYLLLLAAATLASYGAARAMAGAAGRRRKLWLGLGLAVTLGLLVVFKYLNLLLQTVHDLAAALFGLEPLAPLKILLPIGISFYTFKAVSYLIDVYHRRIPAERHVGMYALYVAFFPQLLAGPIDRAAQFIPQLKAPSPITYERVASGLQLVVWGLFKKLAIADRLALFVGEVFRHPEGQGLQLLAAVYFFAFQIYCDFSGYSDIAVGLSRILGYDSMKNFDFPYFARSIPQFWSRWHISLSSWLRDYLFLPGAYAVMRRIRGERLLRVKAETWGYLVAIFLTMLLGGLWHGASWNFVAWGGLFAVYQAFSYAGKKSRRRLLRLCGLQRRPRLHAALSILLTFHLVSLAWVFFRSPTFSAAWSFLGRLNLERPSQFSPHLAVNLVLLLAFAVMEFFLKNRESRGFWRRWPACCRVAAFALFCCLVIVLAVDSSNEFIYFQF